MKKVKYIKLSDIQFEENDKLLYYEDEYKDMYLQKHGKDSYQLQNGTTSGSMVFTKIGKSTDNYPILIKHDKYNNIFEMKILSIIYFEESINLKNSKFPLLKIVIQYPKNDELIDIAEIILNFVTFDFIKHNKTFNDELNGFFEIEFVHDKFSQSLTYFESYKGRKMAIPELLNYLYKKDISELIINLKNRII